MWPEMIFAQISSRHPQIDNIWYILQKYCYTIFHIYIKYHNRKIRRLDVKLLLNNTQLTHL